MHLEYSLDLSKKWKEKTMTWGQAHLVTRFDTVVVRSINRNIWSSVEHFLITIFFDNIFASELIDE